jgi:PAS domain S-box-containing protein
MQHTIVEILLMEDSGSIVNIVKEMLSEAGEQEYAIVDVKSLSEGLRLLKERHFDVILLDLGLPDSRGLSTVASVRKQTHRTPIVVLTGMDHEAIATKALEMDVQDYLIKDEITTTLLKRSILYAIQRKRIVEDLQESTEKLGYATAAADIGLWHWDLVKNEMAWNDQAKAFFGYPSDYPMSYQAFVNPIHEEDRQPIETALQKALSEKTEYSVEMRVHQPEGSVRWVLFKGRGLYDEAGKPIRIDGIAMDITARKQTEVRLTQTIAELSRSNKELEQFAYIISHDLQAPLRSIASFAEILADECRDQLSKDTNRYINFIVGGSRRMYRMIEDILAYSRTGTYEIELDPVDFESVFSQAVENLQSSIEEREAVITREPLPVVKADQSQMILLLQNLIENAIKFSVEKPHIHISAVLSGNEWFFSLKDQGIGIDPVQFNRIFNLFQRLHTEEEYPGTGVGLAICKKIVERHGGKIWVESEPGQGTTFTFSLPETT